MNEHDFTFTSSDIEDLDNRGQRKVVIPKKCENCPTLQARAEEISRRRRENGDMIDKALDPHKWDPITGALRQVHEAVGRGALERLDQDIKRRCASTADELDAEVDRINGDTEGCPGPLTMRAKKDGRVIDITVCANHKLTGGGKFQLAKVSNRSL